MSIWSTEGLFVAGLNLTFDGNDMLLYLTKSLKDKTMMAFPLLLDWVKEQRPGSDKESVNIIAGDFVGVNSFAQDIIQLNNADNGSWRGYFESAWDLLQTV